jgi:hypothetical protein
MERFNLNKLNKAEGKDQYCVDISNKFTTLENLVTEVDIDRAQETIRENIKMSAKESLILHCSILLHLSLTFLQSHVQH